MNLAICLVLTLAALSSAPEITGTVVDYNSKPISGVLISVVAINSESKVIRRTVSESNGSFSFTDLANGAYGLVARTDSACAISDAIEVNIGFTSVVRLRLARGLCQGPAISLEHR